MQVSITKSYSSRYKTDYPDSLILCYKRVLNEMEYNSKSTNTLKTFSDVQVYVSKVSRSNAPWNWIFPSQL
jgi:hypothetical protein